MAKVYDALKQVEAERSRQLRDAVAPRVVEQRERNLLSLLESRIDSVEREVAASVSTSHHQMQREVAALKRRVLLLLAAVLLLTVAVLLRT